MESQDSLTAGGGPGSQALRETRDFAYEGAPGRTRREHLHVTMPGGVITSVPAHRVVNVGTDPDLREPALAGILHRFESGDELAVPFIYHDPETRKFALVLPAVLRHHELAERARLLDELSSDTEHPIPGYVRHFAVVVGLDELAEYLALPVPIGSPIDAARRDSELDTRERELLGWEAELEERQRQLARGEQALEQRIEGLLAREERLGPAPREEEGADRPSSDLIGDDEVEEVLEEGDEFEEVQGSASPLEESADLAVLLEDGMRLASVRGDTGVDDVEEGEPVGADELSELVEADARAAETVDGREERADWIAALELAESRFEAALALGRDGGPQELEAVRRVLGRMTPDETAATFAVLAGRGAEAAEVLMRSLRAPEPYVRHGAALALGRLRPRRALMPLVELVRTEPEELWQEAARVLGDFGAPAATALAGPSASVTGREDRHAYALAALAERGLESEVRALREREGPMAGVAIEAMAMRETVRAHEEVARGRAPLPKGDPVREFSRRFYDALDALDGQVR